MAALIIETAKLMKGREVPEPLGWKRVHKIKQPPVYVYNLTLQRTDIEYWPPTTSAVFEVQAIYGRSNGAMRHTSISQWQSYDAAVQTFYDKIEEMQQKGYNGYASSRQG